MGNSDSDNDSDNNKKNIPHGYDPIKGEWENMFWKSYYNDKESILEKQRKRNWQRPIRYRQMRMEWYNLLLENAYEIEFDGLLPWRTPFVSLYKKNKWLYEFYIKKGSDGEDKYVYLFDPTFMDRDREKDFLKKLDDLIYKDKKK